MILEPALFGPAQHQRADQRAVDGGLSFDELVELAGCAVAGVVAELAAINQLRQVLVLSGPGNNGADGIVAARRLRELGYEVVDVTLDREHHLDDGRLVARVSEQLPAGSTPDELVVVDALFGAGLSRPLDAQVCDLVAWVNELAAEGALVVGVDVPTGLDGATGRPQPVAVRTNTCVTFTAKKPGHLLLPGRDLCGDVVVVDIGIPDAAFDAATVWENGPRLWDLPTRTHTDHKYSAGHTLVISGSRWHTGASRLAAHAALRIGAGAVTIAADEPALAVHAAHVTAIMLAPISDERIDGDLASITKHRRIGTTIIGPALGWDVTAEQRLQAVWDGGTAVVADADALTIIGHDPQRWFGRSDTVLTPHAAEFERVFGGIADVESAAHDKLTAARRAAAACAAVVVYKGADTVVASPDGRAAINTNAPPSLATAGSGDVLAGIIGGLISQGMTTFDAACAGVWLHGEAARRGPTRLIATDLLDTLADLPLNE